jgi:hypothetical protein
MPEGVGYGPQDTASAGLNLNLIGRRCYGYSGVIVLTAGSSSANITALEFTTGNYVSKVLVYWSWNERSNDDTFYKKVNINGVTIYLEQSDATPNRHATPPIRFVIPPYTKFQVFYGTEKSSDVNATVVLTGKIYK